MDTSPVSTTSANQGSANNPLSLCPQEGATKLVLSIKWRLTTQCNRGHIHLFLRVPLPSFTQVLLSLLQAFLSFACFLRHVPQLRHINDLQRYPECCHVSLRKRSSQGYFTKPQTCGGFTTLLTSLDLRQWICGCAGVSCSPA